MFNTYMGMLIWPMIAFGWVVNLMQRGTASLNRINEILHERPSIDRPPGEASISGGLFCRYSLSRRYHGVRRPANASQEWI